MKKISLPLILVAGLLVLGGCASDSKEETEVVKDTSEKATTESAATKDAKESEKSQEDVVAKEFEDVTYNVPSEFIEMETDKDSPIPMVLYLDGVNGTSSFNIGVEDLSKSAPGITLDEYIDYAVQNTGFDYISNKNFELNGMTWNELVSTRQGVKLQQSTTIVDGKAYIFTYGALPENYDKNLAEAKEILKSVKFK